MMDTRAAKLALARQKLKCHQEKKLVTGPKAESLSEHYQSDTQDAHTPEALTNPDYDYTTIAEFDYTDKSKESVEEHSDNANIQDVNITEILLSNKRNLEMQISELQAKLTNYENNYTLAINNNNYCKHKINRLEHELKVVQENYLRTSHDILSKEKTITDLRIQKLSVSDENNNLQEQLEFTKSLLTEKEFENASLHNEVNNLQSQLEGTQLQLQQLTNGSLEQLSLPDKYDSSESNVENLMQKITNLQLLLKNLQKEKDQISSHYEHYVTELNDQLKSAADKNTELSTEVLNLSTRENNLIDQISDMEIRIQHLRQQPQTQVNEIKTNHEITELHVNVVNLQAQLQNISKEYELLQQQFIESEAKVKELSKLKALECDHNSISISKLNADIISDKLAAQRATEQNKKLKSNLQELEAAFVKISRDKLELTEKVDAEKYLNRELTIKLSKIEEKAKDMFTKLYAKDEEMIRLQNSYRELERKIIVKEKEITSEPVKSVEEQNESLLLKHQTQTANYENSDEHDSVLRMDNGHKQDKEVKRDENKCIFVENDLDNNARILKGDAMLKLQERFLKIMGEVADLSDEKHRLEHIILQLQTETDTICEYVALYQQQRSALKKRDEERSAQIKIFQTECDLLKSQLEELSIVIMRLAQDTELAAHFQVEPRLSDLAKVMHLLSNLKNNTLIDPHRTSSELKNFYPCSCCSGQLIDV